MAVLEVPGHDIAGVRADNPGPFTLAGTNTWVVGRDPAWVIDPGPLLEAHLAALERELHGRGGLGGIALTHDHPDHAEAVPALRERFPGAPVAGARGEVDTILRTGSGFGPLTALATPGHALDHLAFLTGSAGFSGDAVLGEGSVFIAPDPGALRRYLDGLRELARHSLDVLCPGHGPLIRDVAARLEGYITHRLEREHRLLVALEAGLRTGEALLDRAWDDVPPSLRPAAALTLAAHLDKLAEEGRLPAGVQRPQLPDGFSARSR